MIHQPIVCYRMDQRWPSGPDKGTLSQRKRFQIRATHNQNRTVAIWVCGAHEAQKNQAERVDGVAAWSVHCPPSEAGVRPGT